MNEAVRRHEFLALMDRLETEPAHVLHVAALSLRLFDELIPLHGLVSEDRLLLEAASYLHDTGWSVARDGKGHHKESARLIREHRWQYWSAPDVDLMAIIARHHRKAPPGPEHEDFAALPALDQHRVRHLASLLRIGDALDRSHTQRITRVDVQILPNAVQLALTSARPIDAEIEAVQRKSDLAQGVWQRTVEIERVRM